MTDSLPLPALSTCLLHPRVNYHGACVIYKESVYYDKSNPAPDVMACNSFVRIVCSSCVVSSVH